MAKKDDDLVTIMVQSGNDNEPQKVFVGGDKGGDVLITRGKPVKVTRGVCERLDQAVTLVPVVEDPDKPDRITLVERQRFPYSVVA
ncbi:MAG: hypothetical protein ACK5PF_10460 [bacterium]|jgi:hypothetical protein